MTKPTRAEKREAIALFYQTVGAAAATKNLIPSQKSEDIFNAILADYAPLSEDSRAELFIRRKTIEYLLCEANTFAEQNPSNMENNTFVESLRIWLAEIDAELEETR